MDRLHKIHLLNERPPDGFSWSRERLTRKQPTSRPDNVWPHMWTHMSDAAKKKAKQRWAVEKPELDNARQFRRKITIKAARGKLEVPMPTAMPRKIPIKSSGETNRSIGKRKTKYACIVDADESTRRRIEGAGRKPHQDHITAKGTKSVTHHSVLCTSSFRCLKHYQFQMQRRQWRKNGKNWRTSRHCS